MNKMLLAVLCAFCTSASATVLTFDGLTGDLSPIPDGYGGFVWGTDNSVGVANGNMQAANNPATPGFGTGVVSQPNVAFNFGGGTPVTIMRSAGDTFTFNDAYFTSSATTQTLTFIGLLGNDTVYTSNSYLITAAGPLQITLNWAGIDSLQILSDMNGNAAAPWVMDNFEFSDAPGSDTGGGNPGGGDPGNGNPGGGDPGNGNPGGGNGGNSGTVPEPFSLSLMGLGLATLGLARRKRH